MELHPDDRKRIDELILRVERLERQSDDLLRRLHQVIDHHYQLQERFDTHLDDTEPKK